MEPSWTRPYLAAMMPYESVNSTDKAAWRAPRKEDLRDEAIRGECGDGVVDGVGVDFMGGFGGRVTSEALPGMTAKLFPASAPGRDAGRCWMGCVGAGCT